MERRIARFNAKITFQKNTPYEDQSSTYTGEESEGEVTYENRVVTFETRYCSELKDVTSTGYRILFDGDAYDIEYVDHMNYQNQILRFKAKREVRPHE